MHAVELVFSPQRCAELEDGFFAPTLHQLRYEIEDGYRRDNSSVRMDFKGGRRVEANKQAAYCTVKMHV